MSADTDASNAALLGALAGPRRVTGDAGSVEQFSAADLIKIDQYLAAKAAASTRRRGLRFNRLIPDGAVRARNYGLSGDGFGFGPRQDF